VQCFKDYACSFEEYASYFSIIVDGIKCMNTVQSQRGGVRLYEMCNRRVFRRNRKTVTKSAKVMCSGRSSRPDIYSEWTDL